MSPGRGGRCSRCTGLPRIEPIVSATRVHRRGSARGDVEDLAAHAGRVAGAERRVDDVPDVREVARLLAVAVDRHGLAGGDRLDEQRYRRRVLRVRALPRAEDVEVAEDDGLERLVDAAEADAVPLRRELRDAVRRDRVARLLLRRRQLPARPVDGRRRREDDAAHLFVARGEQDVQRPLDVDRARRERILHRARHRAERAEVVDGLRPAHGVVHTLVAAQLALDDLDVEAVEVRAVAGGEVVEHAHLVAALEQRADEVRADEAGAAGDEDARHQATASTW